MSLHRKKNTSKGHATPHTSLSILSLLLTFIKCVDEGYTYVYSGESIEISSDPILQTALSYSINTFQHDPKCPNLSPRVVEPGASFTSADIKLILDSNYVQTNPSAGTGSPVLLFVNNNDDIVLRIFYESFQSSQDIIIDATGYKKFESSFCTTLYDTYVTQVLQIVCVQPGKQTQTVFNYSFSFIASELTGNTVQVQGLDFKNRVQTFVFNEIDDSPKEAMYEQALQSTANPSVKIIISTLVNYVVIDLALQKNLPQAADIVKIYSLQKIVNTGLATRNGEAFLYVSFGTKDGGIQLYLIRINAQAKSPDQFVQSAQKIDTDDFLLDKYSYLQVECISSSVNLLVVQNPTRNTVLQCQLLQTTIRNCITVTSNSVPNTLVDAAQVYSQLNSLLLVYISSSDGTISKSMMCSFSTSENAPFKTSNSCTGFYKDSRGILFIGSGFFGFESTTFFLVSDLTHRMVLTSDESLPINVKMSCSLRFQYIIDGQQGTQLYDGYYNFMQYSQIPSSILFIVEPPTLSYFTGYDIKMPIGNTNFLANLPSIELDVLAQDGFFQDFSTLLNITYTVQSDEETIQIKALLNQSIMVGNYLFLKKTLQSGGVTLSFYQCSPATSINVECAPLAQSAPLPSTFDIRLTKSLPGYLVSYMSSPQSGLALILNLQTNSTTQLTDSQLYETIDFEATQDGSLYRLKAPVSADIEILQVRDSTETSILNITYDHTSQSVLHVSFMRKESLFVKYILKDSTDGQTNVYVIRVLQKGSLQALKNLTDFSEKFECATNRSILYTGASGSYLLVLDLVGYTTNKIFVPPSYSISGVLCGSAGFALVSMDGQGEDSGVSRLAAFRLDYSEGKSAGILSRFEGLDGVVGLDGLVVHDFGDHVFVSSGLEAYYANGNNPSLTVYSQTMSGPLVKNQVNFNISNWNSAVQISINMNRVRNIVGIEKKDVDFEITEFDLEECFNGNLFEIDMNVNPSQKPFISLFPRLDFISQVQISRVDGFLSFSKGTSDGSYCFFLNPDPLLSLNSTFLLSQGDTTRDPTPLVFWSKKVIDFGLYSYFEKNLNFVVLYYNRSDDQLSLSLFEDSPNGFLYVSDIRLNHSVSGIEGIFPFEKGAYLFIVKEQGSRSFISITSDTTTGSLAWFRLSKGSSSSSSFSHGFLRVWRLLLSGVLAVSARRCSRYGYDSRNGLHDVRCQVPDEPA